jgi:hypothetical protein
MADAPPKKSNNRSEDLILLVFAFLIAGSVIQRAPQFFQEKYGVDVGSPYLIASAALTADTPVGTKVHAVNGATFFDSSEVRAKEIGTFPPGAVLVVRGGPVSRVGGGREGAGSGVVDRASAADDRIAIVCAHRLDREAIRQSWRQPRDRVIRGVWCSKGTRFRGTE